MHVAGKIKEICVLLGLITSFDLLLLIHLSTTSFELHLSSTLILQIRFVSFVVLPPDKVDVAKSKLVQSVNKHFNLPTCFSTMIVVSHTPIVT